SPSRTGSCRPARPAATRATACSPRRIGRCTRRSAPGTGSDTSTTRQRTPRRVSAMTPRLDLVGIVVADMAASLAFYRRLGLAIPAEADELPHVELTLDTGLRLAWDTEAVITSFD